MVTMLLVDGSNFGTNTTSHVVTPQVGSFVVICQFQSSCLDFLGVRNFGSRLVQAEGLAKDDTRAEQKT